MKHFVQDIFPTPIYFGKMERNFSNKEMEFVKQNSEKLNKNTFNYNSKNTDVLEDSSMSDIKKFVIDHIKNYKEVILSIKDNVDFYITQSWLNYTKENEMHHDHYHPNSIISGVFYFNVDNKYDSITFSKDKQKNIIQFSEPLKYNNYNTQDVTIPVSNGLLVLFPSNLNHRVSLKKGNNFRVSLAFNTFIKGELNHPPGLQYLKIN